LEGGSLTSSESSFWMRLVMLIFSSLYVYIRVFNSRFCISIYILYGIFCISIFLIDKIKIKIKIKV
jgi:hypothetical protein